MRKYSVVKSRMTGLPVIMDDLGNKIAHVTYKNMARRIVRLLNKDA